MDYSLILGLILIFILPFLSSLICVRKKLVNREKTSTKAGLLITVTIVHLLWLLVTVLFACRGGNIISVFLIIMQHRVTYEFMLFLPIYLIVGCIISYALSLIVNKELLRIKKDSLSSAVLLISVLAAIGLYDYFGSDHLIINEICGNNVSMEIGEECYTNDYVELYNNGSFMQDVEGVYLSDDITMPYKKEIPYAQLMAREFLVVEIAEDDFGISKYGNEEIILSGLHRKGPERVSVPATDTDMAYQRITDGDNNFVIRHGTPGYTNSLSYLKADMPVLSAQSGFYDKEFELKIEAPIDCNVYYTLDGSIPDENSLLYEDGIWVKNNSGTKPEFVNDARLRKKWWEREIDIDSVDKAFILRAVAIGQKDGVKLVSDVVSSTYFVGLNEYKKENVLSIIADPEEMFGEDGVAVTGLDYDNWYYEGMDDNLEPATNYSKRGRKYEIGVYSELFSTERIMSEDTGFRVSGGSSRDFAKKRFSIYARNQYSGSKTFNSQVFENIDSHSLKIRQSVAEGIFQRLSGNINVAHLKTMPVTVFINGEYWYRGFLEEKYDKYYFDNYYKIPETDLVVINTGIVKEGTQEDLEELKSLFEFIGIANMGDASNYKEVCNQIDIDSYIDYMCFNIYIENSDVSDMKNVMLFKSRRKLDDKFADGKWRWGLYDLDAFEYDNSIEYGAPSMAMKDTFTLKRRCSDIPIGDLSAFSSMLKNAEFREKFAKRFCEIADECFSYSTVEAMFDIDDVYYYDFWGDYKDKNYYLDFFRDRKKYIIDYMNEYLKRYE